MEWKENTPKAQYIVTFMVFGGTMTSSNIRITSVNCQGLRDTKKRMGVITYLAHLESNILCLQCTHWISNYKTVLKANGHVNA